MPRTEPWGWEGVVRIPKLSPAGAPEAHRVVEEIRESGILSL